MIAVIDNAIPYIKGVLEPYVDVVYAPGDAFKNVLDSHPEEEFCLLVRTRTKCGKDLLQGRKVRMIASATIGKDHIDEDYCRANSICVANAPGCNSAAVMQYVFTSLAYSGILPETVENRKKTTIGVVGAGNVGGKVARLAERLGFRVLRNDPPKEAAQLAAMSNGQSAPDSVVDYHPLEEILESSDIITLHTPLDETTRSLAGERFFSAIKKGAHLINASRGPVVDDNALLKSKNLGLFICDVWNNEPDINKEVLQRSALATPHIAGYSVEGKQNATDAVVRAFADFADINALKDFTCRSKDERHHLDISKNLKPQLQGFFPIAELDKALRQHPEDFEKLRKEYIYRHEFDY